MISRIILHTNKIDITNNNIIREEIMERFKELKEKIKGVAVPMITPFKEDQKVDEDGIRKLTRYLINNGIAGENGFLIPTGSTGESPMLNDKEIKNIFTIVKEEAGNKVMVMGGCSHTNIRTVIKLVNHAEEVGLDSVIISPPYYWRPTDDNILTHYKTISKETNLGIMVYNNWFANQYDMSVDIITRLIEDVPNIVALKENTTKIEKFAKIIDRVGDRIAIINGMGPRHEPWTSFMGAKGSVVAAANLLTKTSVDIYKATSTGDYEIAKSLLKKADPIFNFILGGIAFSSDFIQRIKALMNFVGLPGGIPRLPLISVDKELKSEIVKIIESCELKENWNINS